MTTAAPERARGAAALEVATWVAVTDQRRDVLELSLEDVRGLLTGAIEDWAELGGSAAPVRAYLADSDVDAVASALGLPRAELRAARGSAEDVVAALLEEPGAFALVRPEALRPGLLALIVDGHDPYRDPASDSPLRAASAGGASDFDPVLLLATGELIPGRCTNAALEAVGDYGAMFDGTRDLLRSAEVTMTALEVPLSDLGPPTPCVLTFNLHGSPRAVEPIAEAGIDVVLPIGNHMLDCWDGCSGAAAMLETLERLRDAGLATAGAGADLEAARRPALVEVANGDEVVTFAFLGYDSIQRSYHAAEGVPGVAPYEAALVVEDVRRAREQADVVVVAMNWGVEYVADPTAFQREAARAAIEAGAALVVGNHPHWVQAVEDIDGGFVAYALGNFVFDQDWSQETQESAIFEAAFVEGRLVGYRLRPVVLRGAPGLPAGLYRPELVDPAGEGRPILERIWDAADRLR